MKRTTIFVPEALERDLQLLAGREGRPTAALVREALAEYIAHRQPARTLPSFVGAFASGRSDIAERHEELLFDTLLPQEVAKGRARRTATRAGKQPKAAPRRSKT
jgi:Ribbon-helix-helix protein, copG family